MGTFKLLIFFHCTVIPLFFTFPFSVLFLFLVLAFFLYLYLLRPRQFFLLLLSLLLPPLFFFSSHSSIHRLPSTLVLLFVFLFLLLCFENITKFFEEHFAMRDVIVYAAHRVGKKQLEGKSYRAIVCTTLDERKRAMILDSSKVYLKGTSFFVTEDRTPQEQERRRQAYASRK